MVLRKTALTNCQEPFIDIIIFMRNRNWSGTSTGRVVEFWNRGMIGTIGGQSPHVQTSETIMDIFEVLWAPKIQPRSRSLFSSSRGIDICHGKKNETKRNQSSICTHHIHTKGIKRKKSKKHKRESLKNRLGNFLPQIKVSLQQTLCNS